LNEELTEPSRKTRYQAGDRIFVPSRRFPSASDLPYALTERVVRSTVDRSVIVDVPGGNGESQRVSTQLVHSSRLGLLILAIGDFESELSLIEPLRKSILQSARLLLPDEVLHSKIIRTTHELRALWTTRDFWRQLSHVVIISHAGAAGFQFLDRDKPVSGRELGEILATTEPSPKTFISLACESGRSDFARSFSSSAVCADFIAPYQKLHGAAAALFGQAFLAHHLLDGVSVKTAKSRADAGMISGVSFRRWHHGHLEP
jgi:hypothetical protein